jgi:hypothetical protein
MKKLKWKRVWCAEYKWDEYHLNLKQFDIFLVIHPLNKKCSRWTGWADIGSYNDGGILRRFPKHVKADTPKACADALLLQLAEVIENIEPLV